MEVAVSELRAGLASWLDRVRGGEEVVVTDRGVAVARLVPVEAVSLIEELTRQGILTRPRRPGRPSATGHRRIPARGSVAELVSEQRG